MKGIIAMNGLVCLNRGIMNKIIMILVLLVHTNAFAQDEIMKESHFNYNGALSSIDEIVDSLSAFSNVTLLMLNEKTVNKLYLGEKLNFSVSGSDFIDKINKDEFDFNKQNKINFNNALLVKGFLLKNKRDNACLELEIAILKGKGKDDVSKEKLKCSEAKETFSTFIKVHHWFE